MNYYYHHHSNSLLQSNLIISNNTLSPKSFERCLIPKRENSSKLSSAKLDESIHFNDSLYDSESLKNKIFSPDETVYQTYEDNDSKQKFESVRNIPLSSSLSYASQKTKRKKILVLDLDETLVHSSFKHFPSRADMELSLKFDGVYHKIYVLKRPHVNEFLKRMSELFDLFIFTASIPEYANPVIDKLDIHNVIQERLYRRDCIEKNGTFIKDLSLFQRNLSELILLDNNPISYSVNQSNGIPIQTWHYDRNDQELLKLMPLMEYLSNVNDVRWVIDKIVSRHQVDYSVVNHIIDANHDYCMRKQNKINYKNEKNDNFYYQCNNNNDDYISITKASTFNHSVRKNNYNKQELIKVNQKPFNQSCCLKCSTNPLRKSTNSKHDINDNDNKMKLNNINNPNANSNSKTNYKPIDDQAVKFISLNEYILERRALINKKEVKDDEERYKSLNRSTNIKSQLDFLSNHNTDDRLNSFYDEPRSLSSYANPKQKGNFGSTANDLNNLNDQIKQYTRDNSQGNNWKKKQIGLSYTNLNKKTNKEQTNNHLQKKQIPYSPQRIHVNSFYMSRYHDMNQSLDFETINNINTSTFKTMKKRLMLVKLKEEHKLAPINTFDRDYDYTLRSSLNLKQKSLLFNSSLLPLKADNTFLIGKTLKRNILSYIPKKVSSTKHNTNRKAAFKFLHERKKLLNEMK